ncbi:hypothetical protein AVEN_157806-1 [Araneus ventricosus]|uniref:Uncharacterized protein n=1 Tax=Araneus ventricosus TaxID=182803 RepID=A0A4Y2IPE6_ARAVE|nr:hypothetical protein AVEN_157806-1 [Araneus ventricosus]
MACDEDNYDPFPWSSFNRNQVFVNKDLGKENLVEESYIAQHLIAHAISSYGDVLDLTINKEMRGFVSSACQRYMLKFGKKTERENEFRCK